MIFLFQVLSLRLPILWSKCGKGQNRAYSRVSCGNESNASPPGFWILAAL